MIMYVITTPVKANVCHIAAKKLRLIFFRTNQMEVLLQSGIYDNLEIYDNLDLR